MQLLQNFTPPLIKKLSQKLDLIAESFILSREQVQTLLGLKPSQNDILLKFFYNSDTEGVNAYELLCAITLLSDSTLQEKTELIFWIYDFDKSETITMDELIMLMQSALSSLFTMSHQDAPSLLEIEFHAQTFFNEADINQDN